MPSVQVLCEEMIAAAKKRIALNQPLRSTGIVSSLADERHGPEVYEKTFKYILGTLMKVDEKGLALHIAHYKQTAASRAKAWEMKAVQSRVSSFFVCT